MITTMEFLSISSLNLEVIDEKKKVWSCIAWIYSYSFPSKFSKIVSEWGGSNILVVKLQFSHPRWLGLGHWDWVSCEVEGILKMVSNPSIKCALHENVINCLHNNMTKHICCCGDIYCSGVNLVASSLG